MKKYVIKYLTVFMIFGVFVFASNSQNDKYLDYTNKLINYQFKIKELKKVKSPFYFPKTQTAVSGKLYNKTNVKKSIKINLLSVFDKKVLIKINEFLGAQLISSKKRWVKLGERVYGCKLVKIGVSYAVFKCKNKTLYKSLNSKLPKLRDRK